MPQREREEARVGEEAPEGGHLLTTLGLTGEDSDMS